MGAFPNVRKRRSRSFQCAYEKKHKYPTWLSRDTVRSHAFIWAKSTCVKSPKENKGSTGNLTLQRRDIAFFHDQYIHVLRKGQACGVRFSDTINITPHRYDTRSKPPESTSRLWVRGLTCGLLFSDVAHCVLQSLGWFLDTADSLPTQISCLLQL